ncbi:MAG: DUF4345 family protein [Gammaproteobacteria bacterium]|jgi:hypothetical protein|nr:DUF4345 family protein [Gammaproteobacteria bacterium]
METLASWLPIVGAVLTLIFGLIGFFKPRLLLDNLDIELKSPAAVSEARAVFGGLNLGMAIVALSLGEPVIFTALGVTWGVMTLARFWSLAVDGIGVKGAIPGIVVDGLLCFLFLSPHILG